MSGGLPAPSEFSGRFEDGEPITTEYSYKYEVGEFAALAKSAGFTCVRIWTDERRLFSVKYFGVERRKKGERFKCEPLRLPPGTTFGLAELIGRMGFTR